MYPVTPRLPLIAISVSLAVSACATTTGGQAAPAAPIPATTAETLATLLLSAPEVGSALGGGQVVVTREVSAPWDDSAHLRDKDCLAIAGAAQRAVYDGSGWTALRGQVLREPPAAASWSHFATQAVVLFPTADAAGEFYRRSRTEWAGCSNRELSYAQQLAPEQVWQVGAVGTDRDLLTVTRSQRSPQQWTCQRALGVRGNVAVDVEACSLGATASTGPTAAAAAIAGAIGERLPSA